ncbi:MAG: hypothetical protein ABIJ59_04360 [Pseudomonadota bacterium]
MGSVCIATASGLILLLLLTKGSAYSYSIGKTDIKFLTGKRKAEYESIG